MNKKYVSMFSAILITFTIVTACPAKQDTPQVQGTNKFVSLLRGIVRWPARTVQKAIEVIADTFKGAGAVVTKEAETVGRVATGQLGKAPHAIMDPIKGLGNTTAGAIKGTITAPGIAAQEVGAEQKLEEQGLAATSSTAPNQSV